MSNVNSGVYTLCMAPTLDEEADAVLLDLAHVLRSVEATGHLAPLEYTYTYTRQWGRM